MSGAKTVVDDSMERGLLVQDIKIKGMTARFFALLGRYSFWILVGVAGSLCV